MLPLRDNIRSASFPVVNWALIGVNAAVFLYQVSLRPIALDHLIQTYGMVPAQLFAHPLAWATLVTACFLHGGWFHILSNMWVLFIFGDNVEDRLGAARYLVFYLIAGAIANLLQALVSPGSQVPAIGASGAIAGVFGAYFLLFPRARVLTLFMLGLFWIAEVPALIFLGFWFISQLFSGFAALTLPGEATMGGVAWWAHIGGFVFGLLAVKLLTRRPPIVIWQPPDEYRRY